MRAKRGVVTREREADTEETRESTKKEKNRNRKRDWEELMPEEGTCVQSV